MVVRRHGLQLQEYTRTPDLLASPSLFPVLSPPIRLEDLDGAVDKAFDRCNRTKQGNKRKISDTPEKLVDLCIDHLRTRSDPILIFSQKAVLRPKPPP